MYQDPKLRQLVFCSSNQAIRPTSNKTLRPKTITLRAVPTIQRVDCVVRSLKSCCITQAMMEAMREIALGLMQLGLIFHEA